MSDPVRWNQDGAHDPARDLLRAARRPRPMTAAERARTASRLAQIASAPAAGAALAAWAKLAAGLVGLGIVALAVPRALREPPAAVAPLHHLPADRLAPPITTPAPITTSAPIAVPGSAPESAPAPITASAPIIASAPIAASAPEARRAPPRRAPAVAAAEAPADADALLREAQMLEKARAGIEGDPASSLRSLDEHRGGFPEGQLAAERELLAIDALARLGRAGEARARAQAFLARFPSSPYASKARRIAESNP
jgi:hypothetical protein